MSAVGDAGSSDGVEAGSDRRDLARGGITSFVGSLISAIMGFALTVVLARILGDAGSGVVLQAIAVFTVVLSFARAGMDSAAVWIMPRLVHSDVGGIRGAISYMFVVSAVSGAICSIIVAVAAPVFAATSHADGGLVAEAVTLAGWFIPLGALQLVAMGATRGLGGVLPYVAVGSVGLPTVRPIAVALVATAGGSFAAVTLAWSFPLPAALIASVFVLRSQIRRHERAAGVTGTWWPKKPLRQQIFRYALPRTLSAGLEQSLIWFDVILVGLISGSATAGIYGGASRFVAAGLVVDSALRVVVSPRFSALLHLNKLRQLEDLYRTAAMWLVLFGAPLYFLLGVFAPVVLGWLGPGFDTGSVALAILCGGAILTFAAGNIHSVLLMSGRSGWGAFNKAVVLAINIIGNLILVPIAGPAGAASAWAFCMLLDAVLAAIEVRRFLGVRLNLTSVGYALLVPILTVGVPAMIVRLLLGATLLGLIVGSVISIVLFLTWCRFDRRRLHLADLALMARSR